ncbi:cysteine desulfurase family protein [Alkalihalobacterium chitinilyticum]|uniref:Cysteine desulfurase n=1 Tax=Alkalihalobacterium chitinilyticum TaxID=2980103 RepID=A0ABT5VHL8_9BACI|nr:cysteine desulfurase family protein [Alkalihalobacterium chitinilyticum]MDE5413729.1 cysteine desulfurase [Alkalihalobacterium chitinilyticum]
MKPIYLDHAATSPLHPKALEAMMPYFSEHFGNPSSIHSFGRRTRHALDEARLSLAQTIGAHPDELIFTSGGTEADNMAIIGYALKNKAKGTHIITTVIEHHAVLHTCKSLEEQGFEVTYLPVDEQGRVSLTDLKNHVREETILVSIMYGNNEVGAVQPIAEIGAFLKEQGIAFHTDAVQAYGTIPLDVEELSVQFLSVSAHKINGPKGTGFLYAKKGYDLKPQLFGGEQERKRRAGTENVASIVGFAEAAKIAMEDVQEKRQRYFQFREQMIGIFQEEGLDFSVNGHVSDVLPHVLNISFKGVNVESLLVNLDLAGIAVSSGSACTAGSFEPSHVLSAMFKDDEKAKSSVRFSFGYGNTIEDIEKVAKETVKIVKRITAL